MWAPDVNAHTEDWSKGRDESTMPWLAKMDWVEYYSWDAQTDSFNLEWRDDFDQQSLGDRWNVTDGLAWDGNLSKFLSSQVYISNGELVLKLDKMDESYNPVFLQ